MLGPDELDKIGVAVGAKQGYASFRTIAPKNNREWMRGGADKGLGVGYNSPSVSGWDPKRHGGSRRDHNAGFGQIRKREGQDRR